MYLLPYPHRHALTIDSAFQQKYEDVNVDAVNIVFMRLESGEKIADFLSSRQPPEPGEIVGSAITGVAGTFEVLDVTERAFVSGYQICELKVKELA